MVTIFMMINLICFNCPGCTIILAQGVSDHHGGRHFRVGFTFDDLSLTSRQTLLVAVSLCLSLTHPENILHISQQRTSSSLINQIVDKNPLRIVTLLLCSDKINSLNPEQVFYSIQLKTCSELSE